MFKVTNRILGYAAILSLSWGLCDPVPVFAAGGKKLCLSNSGSAALRSKCKEGEKQLTADYLTTVRAGEKGEKGQKGEKGEKGDKGDKGEPGNDATLDIQTINSLHSPEGLTAEQKLVPNGQLVYEAKCESLRYVVGGGCKMITYDLPLTVGEPIKWEFLDQIDVSRNVSADGSKVVCTWTNKSNTTVDLRAQIIWAEAYCAKSKAFFPL